MGNKQVGGSGGHRWAIRGLIGKAMADGRQAFGLRSKGTSFRLSLAIKEGIIIASIYGK